MSSSLGGIGSIRSTLRESRDLILRGREPARKASFRGVPFLVNTSTNEFGRRIVVHEYPQFDEPFAEDMGRKTRRFEIAAMVIGRDWENERDRLIMACETRGEALLSHPDYGEFWVQCESCSVTESKVNQYWRADFSLVFVENLHNKFPVRVQNPLLALRNAIADAMAAIKDAFTLAYLLAHLPAYAKSYVQTLIGQSTGAYKGPNNNTLAAVAALTATATSQIGSATAIADATVALSQSVTKDIVTRGLTETSGSITAVRPSITTEPNSALITPYQALRIFGEVMELPRPVIVPTTPTKATMRRGALAWHALLKASAAIEATRAQTYIRYQSLAEAKQAWDTVVGMLDHVSDLCGDEGLDTMRDTLLAQKALLVSDIEDRAPATSRIDYRQVRYPTPALAIVYDAYESPARSDEFVRRNHIAHPGFVMGDRLEIIA
jgi:prophage DNA circulation protein